MFYVYILQCSDGTYYVGWTQNYKDRMARHRRGEVKWTSARRPLETVVVIAIKDKYKAIALEDYLKTGSGRAFTKKRLL
jgi:putative endonuclease